MRDAEIRDLIAGGQSLTTAFSRRSSPAYINERGVIEQLTCLANGDGGTLLIGVNQDGTISGCYPFHSDTTDPVLLASTIRRYTSPPLTTSITVTELDGYEVVAISVAASRTPVATTWGVYRARRLNAHGLPECYGMDPSYLFTRYRDANGIDWARVPAPGATMADLDASVIHAARALAAANQGDALLPELSDDDLVRTLGLRDDSIEPIAIGAILLFGTKDAVERYLPHHRVVLVDLIGTRRTIRSTAPLVTILADLQKQEEKVGPAVKELIVNALLHRDYTLPGSVYVRSDEKRTTITSPGGLPRGLDPRLVSSGTATLSPRSALLSAACARLGISPGAGLGLADATKYQVSTGRSTLSWAGTHEQAVTVTASREVLNPQLPGLIAVNPDQCSVDELVVADYWVRNPEADDSDIATATGYEQIWVQATLMKLKGWGLNTHEEGSTPDASPEGKVMHLIATRGPVTSSDIAEELGMSQQQSYRLLRKLVDAGRLHKIGKTRTTRYALP
ncbi:AlbA family DNA-binding domain-containing protein [Corynebacterium cystitidis]|uniref:AlbA family DNA-binding domain-containing protein n=1 Tax=Corynebacterium cystitidis TaxID=35757 RepID=UPI00211E7CA4|nr:RNA-binding domain-containing protein [Corynebacterium cystitidis]